MAELNPLDKYDAAIAASNVTDDDAAVAEAVKKILDDHFAENNNPEVFKTCLGCVDLTTLKSTDSAESVARFTGNVNDFEEQFPSLPHVAAICVYPNFAAVVRTVLDVSDVKIACVSGAFPSSQSFEEIKIAETSLAVANGADEIDVVVNENTGNKVGFKAAGGIRSTEDAVKYYTVVKTILGEEWMTPEYFRLGASSLANALLTSIAGHEVKHF